MAISLFDLMTRRLLRGARVLATWAHQRLATVAYGPSCRFVAAAGRTVARLWQPVPVEPVPHGPLLRPAGAFATRWLPPGPPYASLARRAIRRRTQGRSPVRWQRRLGSARGHRQRRSLPRT
jgi:hypothetical protein